ncbi:MAG TPA: hypothetical protein P5056_00900 [Candidatus Paceibacterota bacterium]|nr:hypothetical protein [Candidatus Paceibacterota bacterium]
MLYAVVRQRWSFSYSSDWSSLHKNERDREAFARRHVESSFGIPIGAPEIVFVSEEVLNYISSGTDGIWSFSADYDVVTV